MSLSSFFTLPAWLMLVSLALHLAAGFGLGALYFWMGWRSVQRLVSGRAINTTIILTVGRIVLLGSLLALASREGAPPLLAMALGILVARSVIVGRVRVAAP